MKTRIYQKIKKKSKKFMKSQIKNVDMKQVGTWFETNLITPFLQGVVTGTAHLLALTLLIKYFKTK